MVSILLEPSAAPNPMAVYWINKTTNKSGQNQIGDGFHALRNRSGNDRASRCSENELKNPVLKVFRGQVNTKKVFGADKKIGRVTICKCVSGIFLIKKLMNI